MGITREQVADLRPGDVVEVASDRWPGVVMRGPLATDRGFLSIGPWAVRNSDGSAYFDQGSRSTRTLTVISRAPRPLYVNHPRTEPVPGDVVRNAEEGAGREFWMWCEDRTWVSTTGSWCYPPGLPKRLLLILDGETGQVVPS